jgi:copper(I)-binding protein
VYVSTERLRVNARVEPGPLSVALLDEIADRLLSIERTLAEERAVGEVYPMELVVTAKPVLLELVPMFRMVAFGCTVVNDGPDPAYVGINKLVPQLDRKAPLKAGDKLDVDFHRPKLRLISLQSAGTSNLRMWVQF